MKRLALVLAAIVAACAPPLIPVASAQIVDSAHARGTIAKALVPVSGGHPSITIVLDTTLPRGASLTILNGLKATVTITAAQQIPTPTPAPTPAPNPTPTPPPLPVVTPPPANASVLASANFDDGTYGSLLAETPGHLAIIADPTNSGHGKVMQVSYACGGGQPACIQPGTTRADLNQFASWNPTAGLGLGTTFVFKGQVFIPANTPRFTDGTLRKLVYFRTNGSTIFDYVINLFGQDVGLEIDGANQPSARWSTGFSMPLGQWVTLEIAITNNSKVGVKDGSTTIWINGAQVLQRTGIAFINTSTERWSWLAIGHQREGVDGDSTPIAEVRYWDNVVFSTQRQP